MRKIRIVAVYAILIVIGAGCASIPPDAVKLNVEVGKGMRGQHAALLKSIDTYFAARSYQLDEQFEDAIDKYFEELTQGAPLTLDKKRLGDVAKFGLDWAEKHTATKKELENTRVLLEQKAREDFLVLIQANATVTALLESSVDVEKATSEAIAKVTEATEGKVDLQKVLERIDALLLQSGDAAGDALSIYEEIKKLIESAEGERP